MAAARQGDEPHSARIHRRDRDTGKMVTRCAYQTAKNLPLGEFVKASDQRDLSDMTGGCSRAMVEQQLPTFKYPQALRDQLRAAAQELGNKTDQETDQQDDHQ